MQLNFTLSNSSAVRLSVLDVQLWSWVTEPPRNGSAHSGGAVEISVASKHAAVILISGDAVAERVL